MSGTREYFRIAVPARVTLRPVAAGDEGAARERVRARHVPGVPELRAVDDPRGWVEERAVLETLERISIALERIDRRLEELVSHRLDGESAPARCEPVWITLSGSGFSGPLALDAEPETLVEVELDLGEAGLPRIPALARVVRAEPGETCALAFEEILPADRERIIQLTIRRQSRALREERRGGEE